MLEAIKIMSDMSDTASFFPGTRLLVFNPRLYKDDVSTPRSVTMQEAIVLRWYGKKARYSDGPEITYPSLVDVVFIGDGRESKGHFTDYVEVLS